MVQAALQASTVPFKADSDLFSSTMVLPSPSRTSSTCSTVLSAFSAARVRVLIRLRAGPLRTGLSAMTAIMTRWNRGRQLLAGLLEKPGRGLSVE
jgi:hypothetical protein